MDSQGLIVVFRNGYYISMAVAIIGFAVSVFLFFKYDIRTIWQIKTGRAERQRVRDLENASRNEGRMIREENHSHLASEDLAGESSPGTEKLRSSADGGLERTPTGQPGPAETTLLTDHQGGTNETTLLNQEPRTAQTTVLDSTQQNNFGGTADLGYGPTRDLSLGTGSATTVLATGESQELKGADSGFCVTQEMVLIHTDEWISTEK